MIKYVYYDANKPEQNLIWAVSDEDITLVKIEVEVGDDESITEKVKQALGLS